MIHIEQCCARGEQRVAYNATERLQVYMDPHVGRDMVSLGELRRAALPHAVQAQVVLGLATNVDVFDVLVEHLGIVELVAAPAPSTEIVVREEEDVLRRRGAIVQLRRGRKCVHGKQSFG